MISGKTGENAAMTGIVIHNAQDIIDALEQHPEFLPQVGNHIMTKRLLELTAQADALGISVNGTVAFTGRPLAYQMQYGLRQPSPD